MADANWPPNKMAAQAALRELATKLKDPYASFSADNKTACKEAFEQLTSLLQDKPNRDFWIGSCGGLEILASEGLLMPKQGKQPGGPALVDGEGGDAQYRTLFALWLISYDEEHVKTMGGAGGGDIPITCAGGLAIQNLIRILRYTKKTRVVRVAIMCLRNMCDKGFNADMIDFGLISVLGTLAVKKWPDEEIPEDIVAITETLKKDVKELSSWASYRTEVISGQVSMKNPCHSDQTFWKQNIMRFEDKDCEVLKCLIQTLSENLSPAQGGEDAPTDTEKRCEAACNDLGEFVKTHPRGARLLAVSHKTLDAKQLVFKAMDHPDGDVKRAALLAVQKIMVSSAVA